MQKSLETITFQDFSIYGLEGDRIIKRVSNTDQSRPKQVKNEGIPSNIVQFRPMLDNR